ncbi:hypothetical protein [Winogradskyella tangerina]|uniref:hypothetical protein n=1 Tax=Winogradskyella tangerina TaxID=2023240 RepID=UPI0013008EF0|nr:hypothetical protein [Winogradskyella tangerina]
MKTIQVMKTLNKMKSIETDEFYDNYMQFMLNEFEAIEFEVEGNGDILNLKHQNHK